MTTTPSENSLQEKNLAASLADFTARLYLNEPSEESCKSLQQWGESLIDLFPENELTQLLLSVDQEKSGEYQQEFFDLFLVPVSGVYHPPFENAHSDGSVAMGLSGQLDNLYQEAGFNTDTLNQAAYFRQLGRSDHLGVELAFYANLLYSAAVAENVSEAELLHETATLFFQRYPGQWAGSYGRILLKNANGAYFKSLAMITIFLSDFVPAQDAFP